MKLLGVLVIIASCYIGHILQRREFIAQHNRYLNCLTAGLKPVVCSVSSVFSPQKFN